MSPHTQLQLRDIPAQASEVKTAGWVDQHRFLQAPPGMSAGWKKDVEAPSVSSAFSTQTSPGMVAETMMQSPTLETEKQKRLKEFEVRMLNQNQVEEFEARYASGLVSFRDPDNLAWLSYKTATEDGAAAAASEENASPLWPPRPLTMRFYRSGGQWHTALGQTHKPNLQQ